MLTESSRSTSRPYIDGGWVDAEDVIEVSDLADSGTFAQVAAASRDDADDALAAADAATRAMAASTIPERCEWLEAIADGLLARKEELAEIIVREAGKPIASARGEVESAAERFRRAVEEARNLQGEYRRGTTAGHEGWEAIVRPEPVGTVLCIAPYNYPLATTALQVAPALAAGNAVVLKPAKKTPISAAVLTDVIRDVGLPRGAFNFLPGRSSDIGDFLAGDHRVDAIAMTGSSSAGERVARQSGMVELHMELGGNAPAVVFPDADLDAAAAACAKGSFKYAGQRCSAVSRVLAQETVHGEMVRRIESAMDEWTIGDLFDEDTAVGPLISESQADWVQELVDDALDRGATLVRGGRRFRSLERYREAGPDDDGDGEGQFFEPTLLADVPHDARIVHEEQFGPVAAVTGFESADDAVELANRGDLGLDAAVFTADHDRAMDLADRLEVGAVRLNGAPSHGLGDVPFGGVGDSGIGREGLGTTIESFVQTKSIVL